MFLSPYDTTAGSNAKGLVRIQSALEQALIEGSLGSIATVSDIKIVAENNAYTESIPPFNHPLALGGNKVAIDLRPFQNRILKDANNIITVPDGGFATLVVKQAMLELVWREEPQRLSGLSDLVVSVFASWIAGTLSRRLNFPLTVEQDIAAIAAWFHLCQYETQSSQTIGDIHSPEVLRLVTRISRTTYVKVERVLTLIELTGYVRTLAEFIDAVRKLEDRRVLALNATLFFNLLAGSWFGGPAAREITAISVEYPPYFISMLHTAVTEKTYRKTPINEIAMRFSRGDAFGRFNNAFKHLVRSIEE